VCPAPLHFPLCDSFSPDPNPPKDFDHICLLCTAWCLFNVTRPLYYFPPFLKSFILFTLFSPLFNPPFYNNPQLPLFSCTFTFCGQDLLVKTLLLCLALLLPPSDPHHPPPPPFYLEVPFLQGIHLGVPKLVMLFIFPPNFFTNPPPRPLPLPNGGFSTDIVLLLLSRTSPPRLGPTEPPSLTFPSCRGEPLPFPLVRQFAV